MSENEAKTLLNKHLQDRRGTELYLKALKNCERITQEELEHCAALDVHAKSTEGKLSYIRRLKQECYASISQSELTLITLFEKLDNKMMRCILTEKYINMLTWEQIAHEELMSTATVQRIHKAALQEFEHIQM